MSPSKLIGEVIFILVSLVFIALGLGLNSQPLVNVGAMVLLADAIYMSW